MSKIIQEITADGLHLPKALVEQFGWREGTKVMLGTSLAEEDIADLRDKYLVLNKGDLEKHIKDKSIPEHPAWEDLITWENTEEYIQKLKNLLSKIK